MRPTPHSSKIFLRPMVLILAAACSFIACEKAPSLRARLTGVHELADKAEQDGALKCAPRELALTRAYIEFAEMELEKGTLSRAEDYVSRAELNAKAAQLQSPTQFCTPQPNIAVPRPGDRDGDGFLDAVDACPDEPENFQGFKDFDGCPDDPDTDGDGILDSVDACVLAAEDLDQYLDDDGCPDLDNDYDGFPDLEDSCPLAAEDPDGYEDQDGCPELDNDGDKVADLGDQCPNTPGLSTREPMGCPSGVSLIVLTECEVKILQQVQFAPQKASVIKESYPVLDAIVDLLDKKPTIKLEIQGHTDDKGSHSYNKEISAKRAEAVSNYLIQHGISSERVNSTGFGEEQPLVSNDTSDNRALNRRVQFIRSEGLYKACAVPTSAKL